jgi:hypothetical protein
MTGSLRTLLTNIIDYAGMFPPAQLPMDEAIRNYARYRNEPDHWMLGKFICPAARLSMLSPFVDELFRDGPPLAISALGRGERDEASFLIGLKQDLMDIASFCERHQARVSALVLETKIPTTSVELIAAARTVLNSSNQPELQVFYEQPAPGALAAIAEVDNRVGHKIRCGGVTPDAFPTPEALAGMIVSGVGAKVPLKFTAGLHHPVRRFDPGVQAMMFGFLNVFCAGILAVTARPLGDVVQQILADESVEHFHFDDDGMSWRELHATVPQIEAARRSHVISFGSCSFDEPRDDLHSLGWM